MPIARVKAAAAKTPRRLPPAFGAAGCGVAQRSVPLSSPAGLPL